jgi:energy-coupling factor transporter transmembrane protein EcfT
MALSTSAYLDRLHGFWGFLSFLSSLLLLLTIMLYGLVLLFLGIVALFRARVKRALAFVLGPVVVVLLFVLHLQWLLRVPLDLLQFYYHRSEYEAVIDEMTPSQRASKVLFFGWGDEGGPTTGPIFYWLVYDESGEIALSDAERTQAWKDRVYPERGEVDGAKCRTAVYRLSGHYYAVTATCD